MTLPESRTEAVKRIAQYLRRKSQPRLLLFAILVFTGIVGAASSFLMLHVELEAMYLRYPIAALIAYVVFLLLRRLWQSHQALQPDLAIQLGTEPTVHDTPNVQMEDKKPPPKRSFPNALDAMDFLNVFDDAPGLFICLLIAVIVGALALLGLVLSFAPILLAEVLLDGLLVAGIWKRFKKSGNDNPLGAAFRITRIPALVVILALSVIGYVFKLVDPSANSIGDVILALEIYMIAAEVCAVMYH
jgi:hypothetical protein